MRKLEIFGYLGLLLWLGTLTMGDLFIRQKIERLINIVVLQDREIQGNKYRMEILEDQWRIYLETPEEKEKKPEPNFDYWSD